jgi:hypothetical protein
MELCDDTLDDLIQLMHGGFHSVGEYPGIEVVSFHEEFPTNPVMR